MARPVFKIFYAWQSDRQQNHNRYLIGEALELATSTLNADPTVPFQVVIDQDTKDEPGLCDIPATILEKISKADAFLCDMTFVATTEADKHCSNPNVLFELGFAFHALGHQRILCVINEEHGTASNQMFDLAHRRHPLKYRSPTEGRSRSNTVETLSASLIEIIKPLLSLGRRCDDGAENRFNGVRAAFEEQLRKGAFYGLPSGNGILAITVTSASGTRIPHELVMSNPVFPPGINGGNPKSRGRGVVCISEHRNEDESEPFGAAEMRNDGTILAADTWGLDPDANQHDAAVVLPDWLDRTVMRSITLSMQRLQATKALLPWTFSVSLLNVKGYCIPPNQYFRRVQIFEDVDCRPDPVIVVRQPADDSEIHTLVKPILDYIWRDFGIEYGSLNFTDSGVFNLRYW